MPIAAAAICVAGFFLLRYLNRPVPDHPFFEAKDFQVSAHRGGAGLGPENTLFVFRKSLDLGADILEMDVRATRDSVLVVIHDPTVDRTTDGSGPVSGMTLSKLKLLDAGYLWSSDGCNTHPYRDGGIQVPTLAEVFDAFPRTRMMIEIKQDDPDIVSRLAALIGESGVTDRVLITAFNTGILTRFRNLCPGVATSVGFTEGLALNLLGLVHLGSLYTPNAAAILTPVVAGPLSLSDPHFIRTIHGHNMRIHFWTINDPDQMLRLIESGADGLITDYPDRLLRLLGRL